MSKYSEVVEAYVTFRQLPASRAAEMWKLVGKEDNWERVYRVADAFLYRVQVEEARKARPLYRRVLDVIGVR